MARSTRATSPRAAGDRDRSRSPGCRGAGQEAEPPARRCLFAPRPGGPGRHRCRRSRTVEAGSFRSGADPRQWPQLAVAATVALAVGIGAGIMWADRDHSLGIRSDIGRCRPGSRAGARDAPERDHVRRRGAAALDLPRLRKGRPCREFETSGTAAGSHRHRLPATAGRMGHGGPRRAAGLRPGGRRLRACVRAGGPAHRYGPGVRSGRVCRCARTKNPASFARNGGSHSASAIRSLVRVHYLNSGVRCVPSSASVRKATRSATSWSVRPSG